MKDPLHAQSVTNPVTVVMVCSCQMHELIKLLMKNIISIPGDGPDLCEKCAEGFDLRDGLCTGE